MTICIIPARLGSKSIKNKNIKFLKGKHLIGHVIKIAKSSGLFKRIIVSTESEKISKIAKFYGAEVPFIRKKKLADDYTPTFKVLIDCVKTLKSEKTPYHFCIYPTAIFIDKYDLRKAFKKIVKLKSNFICPIQKFNSPPLRSFNIQGKYINFRWPKYEAYRKQDLKELYHDTGTFCIYKTKALLKLKPNKLLPKKSTFYILKKLNVDINTTEDLRVAKSFLKLKK